VAVGVSASQTVAMATNGGPLVMFIVASATTSVSGTVPGLGSAFQIIMNLKIGISTRFIKRQGLTKNGQALYEFYCLRVLLPPRQNLGGAGAPKSGRALALAGDQPVRPTAAPVPLPSITSMEQFV